MLMTGALKLVNKTMSRVKVKTCAYKRDNALMYNRKKSLSNRFGIFFHSCPIDTGHGFQK